MAKLTKKQKTQDGKIDSTRLYALTEALAIVKEHATAKFDESIDVAVQLGIDAKKSDQVVRGAVVLPNGTGKTKRVAVFAQGAKAEEAKAAGADIVGMDDLAAQVKAGDMPFDVVIAAPDAMRVVGTLGQILGPRGLNIMEFCKAFNAQTQGVEPGLPLPVVITAFADKSFTFIIKTPPAATLIKKAIKLDKGSAKPNTDKVGKITRAQLEEIAKTKQKDMTAADLDAAVRTIAGSARSMGVTVEGL